MNVMKVGKKKYEPIKTHHGHKWILERGTWGPHTAKYLCLDCGGVFVKWATTKKAVDKSRNVC